LRYAFVVFVVATILAIRLPSRVDSTQGEDNMGFLSGESAETTESAESAESTQNAGSTGARGTVRIPRSMAFALRANCGPRWLSGFLIMFMAFLLRENPIGGWSPQVLLAIVIGAAGLGNTLGIAAGSLLRRVNPATTVVLALLADTVAVLLAALFYGVVTLALLGVTAGLAQALAKLALDATIQRDVPERVQSSAFARSDTTLQLAWVLGGFLGIALPLDPHLGLWVAVAVLTAWSLYVLTGRRAANRVPS
jgi:hypothetical protein